MQSKLEKNDMTAFLAVIFTSLIVMAIVLVYEFLAFERWYKENFLFENESDYYVVSVNVRFDFCIVNELSYRYTETTVEVIKEYGLLLGRDPIIFMESDIQNCMDSSYMILLSENHELSMKKLIFSDFIDQKGISGTHFKEPAFTTTSMGAKGRIVSVTGIREYDYLSSPGAERVLRAFIVQELFHGLSLGRDIVNPERDTFVSILNEYLYADISMEHFLTNARLIDDFYTDNLECLSGADYLSLKNAFYQTEQVIWYGYSEKLKLFFRYFFFKLTGIFRNFPAKGSIICKPII